MAGRGATQGLTAIDRQFPYSALLEQHRLNEAGAGSDAAPNGTTTTAAATPTTSGGSSSSAPQTFESMVASLAEAVQEETSNETEGVDEEVKVGEPQETQGNGPRPSVTESAQPLLEQPTTGEPIDADDLKRKKDEGRLVEDEEKEEGVLAGSWSWSKPAPPHSPPVPLRPQVWRRCGRGSAG